MTWLTFIPNRIIHLVFGFFAITTYRFGHIFRQSLTSLKRADQARHSNLFLWLCDMILDSIEICADLLVSVLILPTEMTQSAGLPHKEHVHYFALDHADGAAPAMIADCSISSRERNFRLICPPSSTFCRFMDD